MLKVFLSNNKQHKAYFGKRNEYVYVLVFLCNGTPRHPSMLQNAVASLLCPSSLAYNIMHVTKVGC